MSDGQTTINFRPARLHKQIWFRREKDAWTPCTRDGDVCVRIPYTHINNRHHVFCYSINELNNATDCFAAASFSQLAWAREFRDNGFVRCENRAQCIHRGQCQQRMRQLANPGGHWVFGFFILSGKEVTVRKRMYRYRLPFDTRSTMQTN